MNWTVERPSTDDSVDLETVTCDSVQVFHDGTLAFFAKDVNMRVLYMAYAPGQWLTVAVSDE